MNASSDKRFTMDRCEAVPALLGNHRDFLIVSGLGGASKDMASLTDDGDNLFTMAGAMGAATSIGLGLALARPDKRVLVVTGDGELLMNVGTLATVGVMNPGNLTIVCVDNGHYGETGNQLAHSARGVDIEMMARGAGIRSTVSIDVNEDMAKGRDVLQDEDNAGFILLRVAEGEPPSGPSRNMDPAACRARFIAAAG